MQRHHLSGVLLEEVLDGRLEHADSSGDGAPNVVEGSWRRASAFYATACFAFTSTSPRKIAFSAQRSL